jgi:dipeptidyl aminopeptidase/acylaminoacyl peptidase
VSVLEDHTNDTPQTVRTTLCVINSTTKSVSELQGIPEADFFAAPIFNSSGTKLAWQQWYHPDMPWEGAEIYVADVTNNESDKNIGFHVTNAKHVAGKKLHVSAAYPSWANNSTLLFTSDESGYQNPWIYSTSTRTARPVFQTRHPEDFSGPAWILGSSPYAIVDDSGNMALFAAFRGGRNVLYLVDLQGGQEYKIEPCPYVTISKLCQVCPGKPEIVFSASKSDGPGGVVRCTLSNTMASATPTYITLKSTESLDSPSANFTAGIISLPQPSMLQIPHEGNLLPVVFYAPTNPAYEGTNIPGEKPPCVVDVHGGKQYRIYPQRLTNDDGHINFQARPAWSHRP